MKTPLIVLLTSLTPVLASVNPIIVTTNITSSILTSSVPTRVLCHTNGHISIAGQEVGGGLAVLRFTTNGTTLWISRYRGTTNTPNERPAALAADSKGNLFIAAASLNDAMNDDFVTIKVDAAGEQQWARRYNSPNGGEDLPRAIAVDAQDNAVVTGRAFVSSTQLPQGKAVNWEFRTIKYSTAGDILWSKGYAEGGGFHDAKCVAIDSSGNAYVGGKITTFYDPRVSDRQLGIVKYNTYGVQQWEWREKPYGNGGSAAEQNSIKIDHAGDIFFGVTGGEDIFFRAYTVYKISQTNALLWRQSYAPYSGMVPQHAVAGIALNQQDVFVTGWSEGSNGVSIATLALAQSDGAIRWEDRFVAATNLSNFHYGINHARQIVSDGADGAFVTGITRTTNGTEMVTIHYNGNGSRTWVGSLPAPQSATNLTQHLHVTDTGVPLLVAPLASSDNSGIDHAMWRFNPHGAWITPAGTTNVLLRFVSFPSRTNWVQYTTGFDHWTELGQVVADADGACTFADTNSPGVTKRFYRLVSP